MKDKKTIGIICVAAVLVILAVIGIIAINKDDSSDPGENTPDESQQVEANCAIAECMKKFKPTNTMEEITEIVGFEPTTDAMIGSDPLWKFDSKNWISYKTQGDDVTIQATIEKDSLKDDQIELPSSSDLQKDLNNESFTYKELVEKVGGEGTLTSISKGSRSYTWVDKSGQKLGATFNNESGKCTVASYR